MEARLHEQATLKVVRFNKKNSWILYLKIYAFLPLVTAFIVVPVRLGRVCPHL